MLDYERASEVIRSASHRAVGICYCRHKMEHLGRDCAAPKEICMTFGNTARSLIRHGFARGMDIAEGLDLLRQAHENNLVQFGENVRRQVNFICNCCGCCCEALIAARRFGFLHPVHTTNFLPAIREADCTGCGKCVRICPVEAIGLVSANDPRRPNRQKAKLDGEICLGCGLCVRARDERHHPEAPAGARHHAAQLHPPGGGHGDRTGKAPEPDPSTTVPLSATGRWRRFSASS